jgi:hypothetical protein
LSNTSVFYDDDDGGGGGGGGGIVSTTEQILLYPSLEVQSGYDTTQSKSRRDMWAAGHLQEGIWHRIKSLKSWHPLLIKSACSKHQIDVPVRHPFHVHSK